MEIDSYYEIGSKHIVCQDYCIGVIRDNITYAILSDGCSASKNSNIGACLIPLIARGIISELNKNGHSINTSTYIAQFCELFLSRLKRIQKELKIPTSTLDATLLIAIVEHDHVLCFGWGDGFYIAKDINNSIIVKDISFLNEAPYYPSYDLDIIDKERYKQRFTTERAITRCTSYIDLEGKIFFRNVIQVDNDLTPVLISYEHIENLKSITLSSDGLKTYHKDPSIGNVTYNALDIIPEVLNYKSTAGEFVTRRMLRMKKDMEKRHILHSDDISCTTIIL